MICQYCGHKLQRDVCQNPACPGRLRKEEDVYMGRACPPNCPGNISTPAPAEVERLVDRINDELFCGALKGETKSRLLAALSNTTPYLSGDVKGWLPIETAPKDGTRIMLGYFPDYMDGKQQGGHPQIAWWNDTKNLWCSGLGFLKAKGAFSPTHWMPLPEPPDRKAGE